jgi:hypothetical protein
MIKCTCARVHATGAMEQTPGRSTAECMLATEHCSADAGLPCSDGKVLFSLTSCLKSCNLCMCRHLTAAVLLSHRPHPSTVRGLDVPPSIQHEEPVRRIRLAAGWRDVDTAVQELEVPDAATAAYALYRLGCLHTFMSAQRRAGKASQCVSHAPGVLQLLS